MQNLTAMSGINTPRGYTSDEIEKLGNSIIYFAENLTDLSKTKLLKLIYLLDELAVKTYGVPFFDLEYEVWQAGPVNVDIYSELTSEPILLKDYIRLNYDTAKKHYVVSAKKKFNDDEFSDNEIDLLQSVVKNYGRFTAKKLVDLCHRENTLWYQLAKENDVLESFESGRLTTTDLKINLVNYLKEDNVKTAIYKEHKEFLNFSRRFKA